jgi:hypothetical protein
MLKTWSLIYVISNIVMQADEFCVFEDCILEYNIKKGH